MLFFMLLHIDDITQPSSAKCVQMKKKQTIQCLKKRIECNELVGANEMPC
jgi:hypothetical protein